MSADSPTSDETNKSFQPEELFSSSHHPKVQSLPPVAPVVSSGCADIKEHVSLQHDVTRTTSFHSFPHLSCTVDETKTSKTLIFSRDPVPLHSRENKDPEQLFVHGSNSTQHADCPGCLLKRSVIYRTCNVHSNGQPPAGQSLTFPVNSTSINLIGDRTVTYSAQAPVSVTRVQQNSDSIVPHSQQFVPHSQFVHRQQVAGLANAPCCLYHMTTVPQHDPEKLKETDPAYFPIHDIGDHWRSGGGVYEGADVPLPCPLHGSSESYMTTFNPSFDIPLSLTYSSPSGDSRTQYLIRHPHPHHPHQQHQQPYFPASFYSKFHSAGLPAPPPQHYHHPHHCLPASFHDDKQHDDGCCSGHRHPTLTVASDDCFHPTASSGSGNAVCPLHGHDDSMLLQHNQPQPHHMDREFDLNLTGDHPPPTSSGCPMLEGVGMEPGKEDSAFDPRIYITSEMERKEEEEEEKEEELYVASSSQNIEEKEDSNSTVSEVPRSSEERKNEAFVVDLDGTSVDLDDGRGRRKDRAYLEFFSSEITRSHTPPERDTGSAMADGERDAKSNTTEDAVAETEAALQSIRSMAFTIDFGNNLEMPEITDKWKQLTPYRVHSGVQERSAKAKNRLKEKSESLEGDQYQKKRGTCISSVGAMGDAGKDRSHSPSSGRVQSVGRGGGVGYMSDGNASTVSSDYEDASICSEMIGCIQGRRRFLHSNVSRKPLNGETQPARSQPSLIKGKSLPQRPTATSSSSHPTSSVSGSGSSAAASRVNRVQTNSRLVGSSSSSSPLKVVKDTKESGVRVAATTSHRITTMKTSPKGVPPPPQKKILLKNSSTVKKAIKKLPCAGSVEGRGRGVGGGGGDKDEVLDVTAYLINRMFSSMDSKSCIGIERYKDTKSAKAITSRLSCGARERRKEDGDNVSQTGTYTIEDDENEAEVERAREDIDAIFGVTEEKAKEDGRLLRPVVAGGNDVVPPPGAVATGDYEDVFLEESDEMVQEKIKFHVEEAVSTAISANQAIQQALLLTSSKKKKKAFLAAAAADDDDEKDDDDDDGELLLAEPSVESMIVDLKDANASSDARHCATVVCDDGDFGTFTISFDAPSPQQKDSAWSNPRDGASTSGQEMTTGRGDHEPPGGTADEIGGKDAENVDSISGAMSKTRNKIGSRSNQRPSSRKSAAAVSSKSLTREATFVKENASNPTRDALKSILQPRLSANAKRLQPSSSFGRWRRDHDAASSESETASLSSMDYSMSSTAGQRLSRSGGVARSSGGKGPVPVPRINRTFALRCSKATAAANESGSNASLVPRSRSAGSDNAKLALRNAVSRSPSRSRSRPRAQQQPSPVGRFSRGDASRRPLTTTTPRRKKEFEQQHSEDSSASICSSVSSSRESAFVRRDGGRYSMRTDRSIAMASLLDRPDKDKKVPSKSKSAGQRPPVSVIGKEHPSSGGGGVGAGGGGGRGQTKEYNAWKRRKQYDPRKSVADAKAKVRAGHDGRSKNGNGGTSEPEDDDDYDESLHVDNESMRSEEIAQLSNAVAYNLNVLAESTKKDSVTLDLSRLHKLPDFSCDSTSSRSAFSIPHSNFHSVPTNVQRQTSDDFEKNSYDGVLVNSIQQVSRKVKTLTDELIDRVRDEKQRKLSFEIPLLSPIDSGSGKVPSWQHASPELAAILENLKRTEQHLKVVHKALFELESEGPDHPTELQRRDEAVERQSASRSETAGFRPIEKPVKETVATRRRSSRKKEPSSSASSNPLSGDEYF